MRVVLALAADIPAWLDLAAEVEPLFGPMADDPGFRLWYTASRLLLNNT